MRSAACETWLVLGVLFCAAGVAADEPRGEALTTQPATGVATTQPTSQPSPPAAPTPGPKSGPKFLALRYDEDFSYLDGPAGSYTPDLFDPVKNIHLGDDWRLSLGGEVRLRFESETNRNFGAFDPTNDNFMIQHYLLHADLKYRKLARVFVQGVDARVADRDLPLPAGMVNQFDLNQAFADFSLLGDGGPLWLRAGQFEMVYGKERLVGPSHWTNVSRRYDGLRLMVRTPTLDLDAWWSKPIVFVASPYGSPLRPHVWDNLDHKFDHPRSEQQFFGAYATYKGVRNTVIDLYGLGLTDDGLLVNANRRLGDLTLYTVGTRIAGTLADFDHDSEFAYQWGRFAGDDVRAWMFDADAGYTLRGLPWTPRVGAGLEVATGDRRAGDGRVQTFNQLFHTGHAWLGYIDLVGLQNVIAFDTSLTVKPLKNVTARAAYYHFWLASDTDALYGANGQPIRRDLSGASGDDVGDEFDVTVQWQVDAHSSLLVGASHFWPDRFVERSGPSRDADLFYLQWQFKF
ncbi:MAG: alginate export family protein [Phycisphaerae bacterium]